MSRNHLWLLALLVSLLLQVSCLEFSPPVEEGVELRFLRGGGVEVLAETILADPRTSFEDHPKAKARLEQAQWEALNAKDAWARRFSRVEWAQETFSWKKRGGNVIQVRRTGRLDDGTKLGEVFRDLPVSVLVKREGTAGELALLPLEPVGGTAEERQALNAFLEKWIPEVQEYLKAESEVYVYLQEHPERARPMMAEMFKECLGKAGEDPPDEAPEEERALMEVMGDTLGKVIEALETGKEDEYSPDELSRRFFDPLPVPLTVELPGPISEVEGFERAGEGKVRYRGTGLWPALETVAGRWVSPDILTLAVPCLLRSDAEMGPGMSLDEILARPRRFGTTPSSEELKRALAEALRPAAAYRVTWRESAGTEPVLKNSPAPK